MTSTVDDPYEATAAAFAKVVTSGRWPMHPQRPDQTGPRLRALLDDTLGDQAKACRREVSLLAAVADAGGVPIHSRDWVAVAELDRLAAQIADDRALRVDYVRWAVGVWVTQLPVTLLAEAPSSVTPPLPPSPADHSQAATVPATPASDRAPTDRDALASPATPGPVDAPYTPAAGNVPTPTTPYVPTSAPPPEDGTGSARPGWLIPVTVGAAAAVVIIVALLVVAFRPKESTTVASDRTATTTPAEPGTTVRSSRGTATAPNAIAPRSTAPTTAAPVGSSPGVATPKPGVVGTFTLTDGWRATQTEDGASVDGSTITLAGTQDGYPEAQLLGPNNTTATVRRQSVLARNDLQHEREGILEAAQKNAKELTILDEGTLGSANDIAYFTSARTHESFQSVNVDGIAVVPDDSSYNARFWVSCSKTGTTDDPEAVEACKQLIATFQLRA